MPDPPSGHPTPEELRAFSLGALGRADLDRLAAHVRECPKCCTALAGLVAPDIMIAQLRQATSPATPSLEDRLDRESAVRVLKRGRFREALTPRGSQHSQPPAEPAAPSPLEPVAPQLPRQIGDHEILEEVGRGGMGVVYKARHCSLNRLVALKMVLAGEFASASDRLRFLREAELAARVKHVNIVHVHEIGHVDDRPFISMEWVEGGTLADLVDGTPWPPVEAAQLIATLALAIDAAHRHGVIHRDLKPANILMQPADPIAPGTQSPPLDNAHPSSGLIPKITDFGLARACATSPA